MAYIEDENVTMEYITFLMTRVGFTDVSEEYPDSGVEVVIRDNKNQDSFYNSLPQARDNLILAYVLRQNG